MKLRTGSLKRLQNWQTFKKTKRGPKSIKSEMRKGEVTDIQKIIRDYYKQWNEQPRRNGQIPISVQSPKTEWIRNMNR